MYGKKPCLCAFCHLTLFFAGGGGAQNDPPPDFFNVVDLDIKSENITIKICTLVVYIHDYMVMFGL